MDRPKRKKLGESTGSNINEEEDDADDDDDSDEIDAKDARKTTLVVGW